MKPFGKINDGDSWWVIVLKIIAYAIGLILGGLGTVSAGHAMGLF